MSRSSLWALAFFIALGVPVCGPVETEPAKAGKPRPQPSASASPSEKAVKKKMVHVPTGPFFFGLTEQQFMFYLSQTTLNYPGMVEDMRARSTSPPRERFEPDFHIGRFEVTNREFKGFIDATSYSPPERADFLKHWERNRYPDWAVDFPVVWVSREDAAAYCGWLGGKLPTQTQWEKAARGGSDARAFPWGEEPPSPTMVNYSSSQLEPVGDRPQDVSPFQVYDLAGNAAEHTRSETAGRAGHSIVRAGSFLGSSRSSLVGVSVRLAPRGQRFEDVGFRCVLD